MIHEGQPRLTVECVVFGIDDEDLKVLVTRRDREPSRGTWWLPGGLARAGESLENTARRELERETGVARLFLEQLYTFGDGGPDPRGPIVSVAYYALIKLTDQRLAAPADRPAAWFPVWDLPPLAFDHGRIVEAALARLKAKVRYQPIGFELLPDRFTLSQLQRLYEKILERPLDKRNFRKKVLSLGFLVETDEIEQDVAHRAARLYRFDRKRYQSFTRRGMNFEV